MDKIAYFAPILLLLAVPLIAFLARKREATNDALPIIAKPIMTDHELAFAEKLMEAVEGTNLLVIPQVAMSAFLQVKPGTEKALASKVRNRFSQKRPDFVLADDDMNVVLIVELDDSSHNKDRDRVRDTLASAAGIKTVRLSNGRRITMPEIRAALLSNLPTAAPRH